MNYYEKAYEIFEKSNLHVKVATTLTNMALINENKKDYE